MKNIYQFKVKDLHGKEVSLSDYKGKVLLIVNTASECGFTAQYRRLEKIYKAYKNKGLEILAFPSNDFGGQEPLEGEAIQNFCERKYKTSFRVFNKMTVKGPQQNPLFQFLSNHPNGANPRWNFQKYLINTQGQVVDFWYSFTCPSSSRLKRAIEAELELSQEEN